MKIYFNYFLVLIFDRRFFICGGYWFSVIIDEWGAGLVRLLIFIFFFMREVMLFGYIFLDLDEFLDFILLVFCYRENFLLLKCLI